jgi:poly(3-hydroxyalkanoate) synthetase
VSEKPQAHGHPSEPKSAREDANRAAPADPSIRPSLAPFLWPLKAAAWASEATASFLTGLANTLETAHPDDGPKRSEPRWTTRNAVALELPSMRLRDFSTRAQGQATLVCAPYALHEATIADFAPGHSVVEALQRDGLARVFVTDWRSATPEMRYFSIDSYLADLNVTVDELGPPVDLVGLCQGGWMALVYAARFPQKVRKLVLVGAPVDIGAGESQLSTLVTGLSLRTFEDLVQLGEGRVLGHRMLELWASSHVAEEAGHVLQVSSDVESVRLRELEERYREWYARTLDLPGTYYLQVVRRLFKENQIAEGRFAALGRPIDLGEVQAPMFLLAARDDEVVSPDQLFAAARLVGTPAADLEMATEPCGHVSLFLGAQTLRGSWRRIARWLGRDQALAQAS